MDIVFWSMFLQSSDTKALLTIFMNHFPMPTACTFIKIDCYILLSGQIVLLYYINCVDIAYKQNKITFKKIVTQ